MWRVVPSGRRWCSSSIGRPVRRRIRLRLLDGEHPGGRRGVCRQPQVADDHALLKQLPRVAVAAGERRDLGRQRAPRARASATVSLARLPPAAGPVAACERACCSDSGSVRASVWKGSRSFWLLRDVTGGAKRDSTARSRQSPGPPGRSLARAFARRRALTSGTNFLHGHRRFRRHQDQVGVRRHRGA